MIAGGVLKNGNQLGSVRHIRGSFWRKPSLKVLKEARLQCQQGATCATKGLAYLNSASALLPFLKSNLLLTLGPDDKSISCFAASTASNVLTFP